MRVLVAVLMSLLFAGQVVAATLEEDVNRYIQIFKGDQGAHVPAAETFAWTGISDTRVFDIIEQRVLQNRDVAPKDKAEKELMAWYIRSLGFSGQQKYIPTISLFEKNRIYAGYVRDAMEDLPQYQKWNPVISNRATFNPKYSDDVNRIMNMLRSDDFSLKRLGAKRIYFKDKDEVLLDQLEKELRVNFTREGEQTSDQIAWMVKALGSSKNPKYLPLFEQILAAAPDKTVIRHTKKTLEGYGKFVQ